MIFRSLGRTGLKVSVVSFGAGPISGWSTLAESARQVEIVRKAIDSGINWFDTAPTYSDGRSESSLGLALAELKAHSRVHVATKVRLTEESSGDFRSFILKSFESSLNRLGCSRVTLLQLHNSITTERGDQPTSVTVGDVVGSGGILEAFEELKAAGAVDHLGLTGLGEPACIRSVLESGRISTVQTPFNLLNPSAGQFMPEGFPEMDYRNQFSHCERLNIGVFAIRVFAGGALAEREPSHHTRVTKFFPLELYLRDKSRAAEIARQLPVGLSLPQESLRFVLSHPQVTSALIGFGCESDIVSAVKVVAAL